MIARVALPTTEVFVNGLKLTALVDSGCTISLLCDRYVGADVAVTPDRLPITMMNGTLAWGAGCVAVMLGVAERVLSVSMLMCNTIVNSYPCILGMDVIGLLGGLHIDSANRVTFGTPPLVAVAVPDVAVRCQDVRGRMSVSDASAGCQARDAAVAVRRPPPSVTIVEKDFSASFDGVRWTVQWTWLDDTEPADLTSWVPRYAIPSDSVKAAFDLELKEWIANGWLVLHDAPQHGPVRTIIPLMAVLQHNKGNKVRPVMDFRKLNAYIPTYTADSAVCGEKLREWRRLGDHVSLLDLRKAYLQLHVAPHLFRHQAVDIDGTVYVLTRLAFGMNVAPKIMTAVLGKVLALDDDVARGTDHYVDDIVVNERVVSAERVRAHLLSYGLVTKEPEPIDGARVLGLRVTKNRDSQLVWARDNTLPPLDAGDSITRRELYSVLGRLTAHYPVGGWLRVACSYLKRQCNSCAWDDDVSGHVQTTYGQLCARLSNEDPVRGLWCVPEQTRSGTLWCDASSIATGACVEIAGAIVEDASWLRKEDGLHINVAELEAVVKGLNLALHWDLRNICVKTDSSTVHAWLTAMLTRSHRIQTRGMAEMLVRRRLGIIRGLADEYELDIDVQLIPSEANRADALTRVPKDWFRRFQATPTATCNVAIACPAVSDPSAFLLDLHNQHHLGVKRTLHLARKRHGWITRRQVSDIVQNCEACQRIDPAPTTWDHGTLSVSKVWDRLAVDVTHYNGGLYLSIVDCGPSRLAIWHALDNEGAPLVRAKLESVFAERGPPREVLFDNALAFKSDIIKRLFARWGVTARPRCAHRPSGNGIVERNHRTIKRMAARSGKSVQEMLFWYNNTPMHDDVTPASLIFGYSARLPGINDCDEEGGDDVRCRFSVGDEVFVKPELHTRCTTPWRRGVVTAIISSTQVDVDNMPRHVADLRLVPPRANPVVGPPPAVDEPPGDAAIETVLFEDDDAPVAPLAPGRPAREHCLPARFADYAMDG